MVIYCEISSVLIICFLTAHRPTCLFYHLLGSREMDFDFENAERNEGMLVVKAGGVQVGHELVEVVTIIRHIEDVEDFRNGRFQAQLLPDKSGIEFTFPSVPSYLVDAVAVKSLYGSEGIYACKETSLSHAVAATDVHDDEERQLRHIIAYFPDGITCNNRHFNYGADGLHLKTHLVMFQDKVLSKTGKEIPFLRPHVRWKVVIETGRARRVALAPGRDNYEADLENAFARMGV